MVTVVICADEIDHIARGVKREGNDHLPFVHCW